MPLDDAPLPSPPPTPVLHPDRWSQLLDALLRGVSHALTNRVAGLLAVSQLARDLPDQDSTAFLPAEVARLADLAKLVAVLPAESSARASALVVDEVIGAACRVMSLHPSGRELAWHAVSDESAPPVRGERWVLLRLVLLMMDAAREHAEGVGARAVQLAMSGEQLVARVRVGIEGAHAPVRDRADDAYMRRLAERLGGVLRADADGLALELPALGHR